MNINFFTWIREGVRQAVLHGVSDAVGHIGANSDEDDMPKRLLEVIRQNDALLAQSSPPRADGTPRPRKLGRSLEQIVNDKSMPDSKAA